MNRTPFTPSLSSTGGEGARRAGEGHSAWFMVPMRGRRTVEALHEPASALMRRFVAYATKGCTAGFLVALRDFGIVAALHGMATEQYE
jgi:hypothetical protein